MKVNVFPHVILNVSKFQNNMKIGLIDFCICIYSLYTVCTMCAILQRISSDQMLQVDEGQLQSAKSSRCIFEVNTGGLGSSTLVLQQTGFQWGRCQRPRLYSFPICGSLFFLLSVSALFHSPNINRFTLALWISGKFS